MAKDVQGLIADIGGTNARFALIIEDEITKEVVLKCQSYPTLEEALATYLKQIGLKEAPNKMALAVACPIKGDKVVMTNHHWQFSQSAMKEKFNLSYLNVLNDFEAIAFSIPLMDKKFYHKVGGGDIGNGNMFVLGPGSGLGTACLIKHGRKFIPVSGEGQHSTMAARNAREFEIFDYLQKNKYTHVSTERVCSGRGLLNLYDAVRAIDGKMNKPALEPNQITEKALNKSCEVCEECVALMMRFLGRVSANFALTVNAYGGIYIAGGIIPQLLEYFENSEFREEFESKGNFKEYMKAIPTFVVTHPYPAFEGLRQDILKN